jgi:tetratricopeptide (TPR) repeat protein
MITYSARSLLIVVPVVMALFAMVLATSACNKRGPVLPAPEPRRPKEVKVETRDAPKDCQVVDIKTLPSAVPYTERSITEAKNLAAEGFDMLQRADDRQKPKLEREGLLTDAVERLITALRADPYNVHATYNLAAAYARIDRPQCAVNLLERLVELRKLPSQKDEVEAKLDRLLGRGRYKRKMDPDFRRMRDQTGFREVVKKFCPSLPANAPLDRC